jgi:hypothetical protein
MTRTPTPIALSRDEYEAVMEAGGPDSSAPLARLDSSINAESGRADRSDNGLTRLDEGLSRRLRRVRGPLQWPHAAARRLRKTSLLIL